MNSFAYEWATFSRIDGQDDIFADYFDIFPWHLISKDSVGLDFGCGGGRWAARIAPRVSKLTVVDVHGVLPTTAKNLVKFNNIIYRRSIPPFEKLFDFAYSLGVLHHIKDTKGTLDLIANALKPGAPFLIYLYYAFDNKPRWYKWLWKTSNLARLAISRLPHGMRLAITTAIALLIYWPFSRLSSSASWPLSYYADKPFYIMRNDAYDRFSTRLEKRFSKSEIEQMLTKAGFCDIVFSDRRPFWCAVGIKGGEIRCRWTRNLSYFGSLTRSESGPTTRQ